MNQEPVVNKNYSNIDDPFEKIINSGGCVQERETLQKCHYEKRDWRACSKELEYFRQCWISKNNDHKITKNESLDKSI
ncbi:hypothetical protein PORY_000117 [Pneumocystis oryctolagi]|uniref:Uncharacterized protein n=1 Tax=Pneumocystis oryctolagi TaxID=42067 RepID=A0ACB7CED9_9ASCO|nr:hypothetical protein PORY_000117 [Pneumocystis oryctolagi]